MTTTEDLSKQLDALEQKIVNLVREAGKPQDHDLWSVLKAFRMLTIAEQDWFANYVALYVRDDPTAAKRWALGSDHGNAHYAELQQALSPIR